jgi:hypothetical protein
MRRCSRYAAPFDDEEPFPVPERISNPIARAVTAFHEDRSGAELGDAPRRRFLIGCRSDLHAGKGRRFGEVWRNEVAERQELADDRAKAGRGEELRSARRANHWIEDDVSGAVTPKS